MQADSIIDGVSNTQGYGRYTYVKNNPLNATDPTGFSLWSKFRDSIVKPIAMGVITAYCPVCGAAIAATMTYRAGGSFFDIALAAFSTYAMADLGKSIGGVNGVGFGMNSATLGFAMVGGTISVMQGGKFGHGFVAAGAGALSGAMDLGSGGGFPGAAGRTLVRAIYAGTISEQTGGKFANGAATAAFSSTLTEIMTAVKSAAGNGRGTPVGGSRPMTEGEKALNVDNGMAIKDVEKARIYRKGYFGLDKEIMAPDGNVYIGSDNEIGLAWSEDYSTASLSDQSLFLHESVHVYETRTLGCGAVCMGARRLNNSNYDYQIQPDKSFYSYGIEERAAMVQDRFLLQNGLGHWRTNTSTIDQLNGAIPY